MRLRIICSCKAEQATTGFVTVRARIGSSMLLNPIDESTIGIMFIFTRMPIRTTLFIGSQWALPVPPAAWSS
jgi:hypothetical protein